MSQILPLVNRLFSVHFNYVPQFSEFTRPDSVPYQVESQVELGNGMCISENKVVNLVRDHAVLFDSPLSEIKQRKLFMLKTFVSVSLQV